MVENLHSEEKFNDQALEIRKKLVSHKIPIELWGTGSAKTISHLVKEVLEGESTLVEENGELVRRVAFVKIDVRYILSGVELQLTEDRQEFTDGRVRRRGLTGVSEKMKPGEKVDACAKRAIAEELGVNDDVNLGYLGVEKETLISLGYPGLRTEYKRHKIIMTLPDLAFKMEGYVEKQSDKSTYFVWKKA